MDFGKSLRKRKSQKKYEAFYCSEIQSQKGAADKLSCLIIKQCFARAMQIKKFNFFLLLLKCREVITAKTVALYDKLYFLH